MNAEKRIINQIKTYEINEDKADFNTGLRKIVMNYKIDEVDNEIVPIISNEAYDLDTQFAVYYAVFIYYRRYEYHTKLYGLVDAYSGKFGSKKFNSIVLSQYYKFKFLDTNNQEFAFKALSHSRDAVYCLNNVSGVLHNYSELVASCLESDVPISKEEISSAIEYINRAIGINGSYPKQYATKGRLLSFLGDYDKAKNNIRKAIDLEDADGKDSLIRISQYNNYLIDIKTRESIEMLKIHMSDAENRINEGKISSELMIDKMESMQSKYLELLAFFSGVLSLIITVVVEIGIKVDKYNQMMGIIMTLGGVLLLSFSGLRMMISYSKKEESTFRLVCLLIISILMLALGFIIGNI